MCLPSAPQEEGTQGTEKRSRLACAQKDRRRRLRKPHESDQPATTFWQLGMASAEWESTRLELPRPYGAATDACRLWNKDQPGAGPELLSASIGTTLANDPSAAYVAAIVRTRASTMAETS